MKLRLLLPTLAFAALQTLALAAPLSLFDGKSLEGWESREPSLWKVEDGCIVGGGVPKIPHNDFLCTKRSFSNFVLKLKIKLTGDPATGLINSGVQIRTARNATGHEVCGYQCDYGEPNWYGGIYDEGRRNKFIAPADMTVLHPVIKLWDWNEYTIRAEGNRIQTWINGVPGVDYREDDPNIPQDGILGIQVHAGGNTKVELKDLTIEELPPTPDAPTWEKLGGPDGVRSKVRPPGKAAAAKDSDARENIGAGAKAAPQRDISYNSVAGAAKTPEEERATFTVPEGFEVQLVAAESEGVGKFVPLAFDQHGALWTTTAFEYPVDGNENPAAADALYASHAKDKVLIYDRDANSQTGYASHPRIFMDGLAIPLGVLPYNNGCYVLHGHDIVFAEDTDGDGKADKTTVILTGFGVQDSHLFPHQFTRAPGGWIWMAQGAFNYSKVRRPDEPAEKAVQFDQTRMAKFRPDGSGFDITSNGPCNIWGLVLNGEGEAFIQEANDFGYPVMPFHEYANYPGCSDRQWKSYGPEFPGTAPDFRMGGTGLSGLALLDERWVKLLDAGKSNQSSVSSNQSGAAPTGTLITDHRLLTTSQTVLVANPITNRIQGIKMHRDGPYWKLDRPVDFLVSSDPWFRPVAITVGPDGCLYIVDWYNKIISHNEVPRNHPDRDKTRGRIWRVVAKGVQPFDVPDFTKLTGDELIAKLGGESLAQSHLAWQTIGERKDEALASKLRAVFADEKASAERRIQALWAIVESAKITPDLVAPVLDSTNRNLRREAVAAYRNAMVGAGHKFSPANLPVDWPDYPGGQKSLGLLADDADPEVRFAAISALEEWASFRKRLNISTLRESDDAWIESVLAFARKPLAEPLAPSTKNGKPIKVREAYDREFERYLVRMFLERQPDAVAKFLDSDAAKPLPVEARLLASLALEPKASAARVAKLLPQLQRAPGQEEVLRLAQFPEEPGVGEALKAILANPATRVSTLDALLAVRTRLDAAKLAPMLTDAAGELLKKDAAAQQLGIQLAAAFKLTSVEPALVEIVGQALRLPTPAGQPDAASGTLALQLAALRALADLGSTRSDLFAKLAESSPDAQLRDAALAALASSKAADAPAKVLTLYPKLPVAQQHTALDRLSTTKPGAAALVAALAAKTIPAADLDGPTLDRLQTVLGANDPALAKLVDSLGNLFQPVLALDGSDDAWAETQLSFDGALTVETWVRLAPEGRKIGNADAILGVAGKLDINFFDAKLRVFVGGTLRDVVVATKPIAPEMWTHVAAVRTAEGRWSLYINGELDNANSKAPAPGPLENVRIGWSGAKDGTQGAFAEYRLWNCARSADEIRRDFDRSFARGTRSVASVDRERDGAHPASGDVPPGLVFQNSGGGAWGRLQKGARVTKTSDLPPILTAEQALALDGKFSKYRALAAQPGDIARGSQVAALCRACHLLGKEGGNIGPVLSSVGAMGTEAILRNIITPNAAMENGYRIFRVEKTDGSIVEAFFVSEDPNAVVVRLPGAGDQRLERKDIRSTKYLRRSLMPEGILDTMTDQQASDLFAYLLSLK